MKECGFFQKARGAYSSPPPPSWTPSFQVGAPASCHEPLGGEVGVRVLGLSFDHLPLVASVCSKRGIVFQLYTAARDLQAFCVKLPPAPNLRALGRVAVGAQRGPRCWLSSARTVESSALESSIELGRGNWAVVGKPGNAVRSAERWAADGRGWRGDEGGRASEA